MSETVLKHSFSAVLARGLLLCSAALAYTPAACAQEVGSGCGSSGCVVGSSGLLGSGPTPEIIARLLRKRISQGSGGSGAGIGNSTPSGANSNTGIGSTSPAANSNGPAATSDTGDNSDVQNSKPLDFPSCPT